MRVFLILFLLISGLFACYDQVHTKYENYYEIIDDFMRFYYYDSDVAILNELAKVIKSPDDNSNSFQDAPQFFDPHSLPPPPPQYGRIYISKSELKFLNRKHIFDTNDLQYFYDQISDLENFTLDPLRVNKITIKQISIDSIFKINSVEDGFKILKEHYKVDSYIQFSNPLISKDGKLLIFDIDSNCGRNCGHGDRYIVQKHKGKWRVIYHHQTWIS